MEFKYTWKGTRRVPQTITFPDETVHEVQYMRDGIILFCDGKSCTYQRVNDSYRNEIEITTLDTFEQIKDASSVYIARVKRK